jgi:hypothetical protein
MLDVESHYLPALNKVNRRGNPLCNVPQTRPVVGRQDDNRQPPASKILLIADILIASEQDVEPRFLDCVQQFTVLESLPSQLIGARDLMSSKRLSQRCRRVSVEENLHATAAGCSRELLANLRTS